MSLEEAKNDVVRILDRQTIKKVRTECERLAEEKDLPQFEEFLQTDSHFIVTDKRARILNGVHQGLVNKESPGVILHGAYGSGKTVIMVVGTEKLGIKLLSRAVLALVDELEDGVMFGTDIVDVDDSDILSRAIEMVQYRGNEAHLL